MEVFFCECSGGDCVVADCLHLSRNTFCWDTIGRSPASVLFAQSLNDSVALGSFFMVRLSSSANLRYSSYSGNKYFFSFVERPISLIAARLRRREGLKAD
jgi:hypothetical protein